MPDQQHLPLTKDHKFVIVACDGLWDGQERHKKSRRRKFKRGTVKSHRASHYAFPAHNRLLDCSCSCCCVLSSFLLTVSTIFLLLVMSDTEAVNLVSGMKDAKKMADKLVKTALARGTTDNVSAMVVRLQK